MRQFCFAFILSLFGALPATAFEECRFAFELDTQSSAFQALVDGAADRGGFWRPINEAPDDVKDIARFIGRLDFCLRTADGKPAQVTRGGRTHEIKSPFVTSCTAALLSDNRLLTNVHCYYDPSFVAAGFTIVDQVRINFGYTAKDMVSTVKTFPVSNREISLSDPLDAMVLQVLGDANSALGGHVPMVMEVDPRPRRALTMIHHPKGDPQQFSSGTCQIHPRQSEIPQEASQLRHSCETTGGSSGSLLLDARTLAVVGLHNTGGLSAQGGYNGGHKIEMIEAALDIGFTSVAPAAPGPSADPAGAALLDALLQSDAAARRTALEAVMREFPESAAADTAQQTLAALTVAPKIPLTNPGILVVAADGSGQFDNIADAVAAAPEGARIEVRPGSYETGGITVDKSLDIVGIGDPGDLWWEVTGQDVIEWQAGTGTIDNLTLSQGFDGDGHVLRVSGGKVSLRRSIVTTYGERPALVVEEAGQLIIEDTEFWGCLYACLHASDQAKAFIYDSRFPSVGDFEDDNAVVEAHDAAQITIENNEFSDAMERTAIRLTTSGAANVTKNTLTGLLTGLEVTAGQEVMVSDNTFKETTFGLVIHAGANPVFKDNTISDCVVGIRYLKDAKGTVEDNTIRACRKGGIEVDDNADVMITGNRISDIKKGLFAIAIRKGVTGRIVSNDLRDNDVEIGSIFWADTRPKVKMFNNDF